MQPMFEPDPLSFPKPKPFLRSLPDRRPSQDSKLETPKATLQKKLRGIRLFTKAWITIRKKLFLAALKRNARPRPSIGAKPSIVAKKITPRVIKAQSGNTPLMPAVKIPVKKPVEAKVIPKSK